MPSILGTIRKNRWHYAYLFILPILVVFGLFRIYPSIQTLVYSFFDINLVAKTLKPVALKNFLLLVHDATFLKAVKNTLIFALYIVSLLHGARARPGLPVHLPHARRGGPQGGVLRAVHHEHGRGGRGLDVPLQPALRAVQQHPGDLSACPGAAGSPPARTRWRASSSSASGRRSATTWSSSSRGCRTSPTASTRRPSSTGREASAGSSPSPSRWWPPRRSSW